MSVEQTFTQEQILFLFNQMFDTLKSDFNYDLGVKKRKALFARVFNARNFDALIQRSSGITPSNNTTPLFECYQWYRTKIIDGEYRHLNIGDPMVDELILSELQFKTPEEAIQCINDESWGSGPEDIEDLDAVLVKVEHREIPHPFAKKTIKINPDSCDIDESLLSKFPPLPQGIGSNMKNFTENREPMCIVEKLDGNNVSIISGKLSTLTGKQGLKIRTSKDLKRAIDLSGALGRLNCTKATALDVDDEFCDIVLSVDFGTKDHYVDIHMSLSLEEDEITRLPIRIEAGIKKSDEKGLEISVLPEHNIEKWQLRYKNKFEQAGTMIPEDMLPQLFDLVQDAYKKVIMLWLGRTVTK